MQDLTSRNPRLETEKLHLQDRDQTEMLNPQDRDETETFHFSTLSRPRQDKTFNLQHQDETETFQKTSRDRDVQDRDYIPVNSARQVKFTERKSSHTGLEITRRPSKAPRKCPVHCKAGELQNAKVRMCESAKLTTYLSLIHI